MQPYSYFTSSDQSDIYLNSILNPLNRTNSPKNLHQQQFTTPEEDLQHKHLKDALHTFEE